MGKWRAWDYGPKRAASEPQPCILYNNFNKNETPSVDGRQRDQNCSKVIARRALSGRLGVASHDKRTASAGRNTNVAARDLGAFSRSRAIVGWLEWLMSTIGFELCGGYHKIS